MFDGPTVKIVDGRQDHDETRINAFRRIPRPGLRRRPHLARPDRRKSARGKPMRENEKYIARVSSDEARRLKGETDYARLDALIDDDIVKAVANDPDAMPVDIDWTNAHLTLPPGKEAVTLRLDRDVLKWLRSQGKGYQTRINQVLRAWYDAARHKKGMAIQKAAEARAAKKAAAKRAAKKAAPKRAPPAKKRAF
jgi:uncharacterized protein (DUF4415 family)